MAIGQKTGGRKPGSKNKRTRELEARVEAMHEGVDASGMTPLDFLLCVMRDSKLDTALRLDAAKAAARYVHPTLGAVQHSGPNLWPIQTENRMSTDLELARMIAQVLLRAEREIEPNGSVFGSFASPSP
jgi:hypothetical protein